MPTHKERVLAAARGENVDTIPFVPRLEIWYNAHKHAGTLPQAYRDCSMDDIARSQGWPLYKVIPHDYDRRRESAHALHRALGIYPIEEAPFRIRFDDSIEVKAAIQGLVTTVEYQTPVGAVKTVTEFTDPMLRSGTTESWIREHAIKTPADYIPVAYLFTHIEVIPAYEAFYRWRDGVGEDGLAVAYGVPACSPMHLIQKVLIDPTDFFYQYHDHSRRFQLLAGNIESYYDQVLAVCAGVDAEAVLWGENIDGTLTPPPFLKKEILPWINKAADRFHAVGKIVFTHTDGENSNLMDLIKFSGIDVAESVCPYPMTKVTIDEFYRHWSDRLTLMGGIPSDFLIPRMTSEADFEGYLDYLFKAVAPGRRIIFGVSDNVPPAADFNRLVRLGERVREECRCPLKRTAFTSIRKEGKQTVSSEMPGSPPEPSEQLRRVRQAMAKGDGQGVTEAVGRSLAAGIEAEEILQRGLIAAMEVIGVKFKNNEMFMPEVLLCARAMNAGLASLKPHLVADRQEKVGKVVIGTVYGDMHDIGKNMVKIMLNGVGYEVLDLGINVGAAAFVEAVAAHRPDVLALSALLSTTMPEMRVVIEALTAAGLRDHIAVIVGGAPVSARFCEDIGADGYAETAGEVAELIRRLTKSGHSETK